MGSSNMCRSASWMWTGTSPSWACTTSLTPPTWSTWPCVLSRATRRRLCCSSRSRMLPGSGGASINTHSPPGPEGATTQALVAAIHNGSPSISTKTRLSSTSARKRGRHPVGERMILQFFERHRQRQAPVRPFGRGAGHIRPFDDGDRIVERARHQQRASIGQRRVGADDDVLDASVVVDRRQRGEAAADLLPTFDVRLQLELALHGEVFS